MKFLPITALATRGADYVRTAYHVVVSPDITHEDVLMREFWTHHARRLQVGDLVDVVSEDGQFDMQVRVAKKPKADEAGWVEVRLLRLWVKPEVEVKAASAVEHTIPNVHAKTIPTPGETDEIEGFHIAFAPKTRWRVFRRADGQEIKRDLPDKDAAIAWARNESLRVAA